MDELPSDGLDLDLLVTEAISAGEPNRVRKKLRYFYGGISLLALACIVRRVDLAEELLDAGAKAAAGDLVHVISRSSDATAIGMLLERGASPDTDCIRTAMRYWGWETVFILLDHGIDIQTPVDYSFFHVLAGVQTTLLHTAAWNGDSDAAAQLLRRGAAVDSLDSEGMTPLMKACEFRTEDHKAGPDTVYWLLKAGANPNATTPQGETPLLLATGVVMWPYSRRTDVAQVLLRRGADPNVRSPLGTTALMFAARDNDSHLARALLAAGADPTIRSPDGRTALDVARERHSRSVVELLG